MSLKTILSIIAVCLSAYMAYIYYQISDMSDIGLGAPIPTQIAQIDSEISQISGQISSIGDSDAIRRYAASRQVISQLAPTDWANNISQLDNMYQGLRALSDRYNYAFVLSDFVLDQDSISMRGQVAKLQAVYASGVGFIDKLKALPFLTDIQLPYYKKESDKYSFEIRAKISSPDGLTGKALENR